MIKMDSQPQSSERRIRRIDISMAVLLDWLLGKFPLGHIISDLPADAKIIWIGEIEGSLAFGGWFSIYIESETYELVPDGARPPICDIVFTHHHEEPMP